MMKDAKEKTAENIDPHRESKQKVDAPLADAEFDFQRVEDGSASSDDDSPDSLLDAFWYNVDMNWQKIWKNRHRSNVRELL